MAQTTQDASFGPVFVVAAFPVPRLRRVQQKKVLVNMKKQYFKKKNIPRAQDASCLEPLLLCCCCCHQCCCCVAVSVTSAPTTRGAALLVVRRDRCRCCGHRGGGCSDDELAVSHNNSHFQKQPDTVYILLISLKNNYPLSLMVNGVYLLKLLGHWFNSHWLQLEILIIIF